MPSNMYICVCVYDPPSGLLINHSWSLALTPSVWPPETSQKKLICNFSISLSCFRFTWSLSHNLSLSLYNASTTISVCFPTTFSPSPNNNFLDIYNLACDNRSIMTKTIIKLYHCFIYGMLVARRALLPCAPVLHCVRSRSAKICKCLHHLSLVIEKNKKTPRHLTYTDTKHTLHRTALTPSHTNFSLLINFICCHRPSVVLLSLPGGWPQLVCSNDAVWLQFSYFITNT